MPDAQTTELTRLEAAAGLLATLAGCAALLKGQQRAQVLSAIPEQARIVRELLAASDGHWGESASRVDK